LWVPTARNNSLTEVVADGVPLVTPLVQAVINNAIAGRP
jgi:hypothetical protein